jgi:LmbE family N-acetylglucosaminyl deacetylase
MGKSLLAVLAHPDDESFGFGGTLALYAHQGCDTYCLCATRGEAGTVESHWLENNAAIADLRTQEFVRAAKILGLREFFFLGYRDSGMPGMEDNHHPMALINHDVEEVAAQVVRFIRRIRPDLVLTFDPIGGYKHPDHVHIHRATVLAFEKTGDSNYFPEFGDPYKPKALYFQVFPRRFLRWMTRIMRLFGKDPSRWGRNGDINLQELIEVDFPVHVRVDIREVVGVKLEAGSQHASQAGGRLQRGMIGLIGRAVASHEDYMQAYPPPSGELKIKHDLFEGI